MKVKGVYVTAAMESILAAMIISGTVFVGSRFSAPIWFSAIVGVWLFVLQRRVALRWCHQYLIAMGRSRR